LSWILKRFLLILTLIGIVLIGYGYYKKEQELKWEQKLQSIYQKYGDSIIRHIKNGDLYSIQSALPPNLYDKISLEDIALFIDTLQANRLYASKWHNMRVSESNATIAGKVITDSNKSYPVDMMIIKKGDRFILGALKIGNKNLLVASDKFPLCESIYSYENLKEKDINISEEKLPVPIPKEIEYTDEVNETNTTKDTNSTKKDI